MVPRSHCRNSWGEQVDESHICASEPNQEKGACYGDSGGPLGGGEKRVGCEGRVQLHVRRLKGHAYDDFTRVSSYVDWVKDATRYGPWVVGECSASCREGTRLDRRTCAGDNCTGCPSARCRISR